MYTNNKCCLYTKSGYSVYTNSQCSKYTESVYSVLVKVYGPCIVSVW